MRKLILGILLGTALFFCGCREGGTIPLGPTMGGHEIAVFLRQHPDFSGTGPVVDEDYRLVKPEWVKANVSAYAFGDCDDYAAKAFVQAQSNGRRVAFGMVISSNITSDGKLGGHAFNFFITPDKEVWFYEPQTHRVWKPTPEELWYLSRFWI